MTFYGLAGPILDFPARNAAVEFGDEFFLGERDRLFGLGSGENRQQFFVDHLIYLLGKKSKIDRSVSNNKFAVQVVFLSARYNKFLFS